MILIGIDPGYDRLGVAVIEKDDSTKKETLVYSTCIETDKKQTLADRLVSLGTQYCGILQTYKPHEAAIEDLFFFKNQKTAIAVAAARGVLLYETVKHGISITTYTPAQIKVAVTGLGSATKQAVSDMIPRLIAIDHPIRYDDEYDAIAVALTHSASRKFKKIS